MLDKKWSYKFDPNKHPCYQPVFDCRHWPVLGSFNNRNIVQFTNKTTSSEELYAVHKVVLGGISDNMASLVKLVEYGDINTVDPTTMGYYVIKYLSGP